jgi:hypothetical protein
MGFAETVRCPDGTRLGPQIDWFSSHTTLLWGWTNLTIADRRERILKMLISPKPNVGNLRQYVIGLFVVMPLLAWPLDVHAMDTRGYELNIWPGDMEIEAGSEPQMFSAYLERVYCLYDGCDPPIYMSAKQGDDTLDNKLKPGLIAPATWSISPEGVGNLSWEKGYSVRYTPPEEISEPTAVILTATYGNLEDSITIDIEPNAPILSAPTRGGKCVYDSPGNWEINGEFADVVDEDLSSGYTITWFEPLGSRYGTSLCMYWGFPTPERDPTEASAIDVYVSVGHGLVEHATISITYYIGGEDGFTLYSQTDSYPNETIWDGKHYEFPLPEDVLVSLYKVEVDATSYHDNGALDNPIGVAEVVAIPLSE